MNLYAHYVWVCELSWTQYVTLKCLFACYFVCIYCVTVFKCKKVTSMWFRIVFYVIGGSNIWYTTNESVQWVYSTQKLRYSVNIFTQVFELWSACLICDHRFWSQFLLPHENWHISAHFRIILKISRIVEKCSAKHSTLIEKED